MEDIMIELMGLVVIGLLVNWYYASIEHMVEVESETERA